MLSPTLSPVLSLTGGVYYILLQPFLSLATFKITTFWTKVIYQGVLGNVPYYSVVSRLEVKSMPVSIESCD